MSESSSTSSNSENVPNRFPAARMRNIRWTSEMKKLNETGETVPAPPTDEYQTPQEIEQNNQELIDYFKS